MDTFRVPTLCHACHMDTLRNADLYWVGADGVPMVLDTTPPIWQEGRDTDTANERRQFARGGYNYCWPMGGCGNKMRELYLKYAPALLFLRGTRPRG
jgi:hypothetical protein